MEPPPRWLVYALLSAACAAVIPIFGKLGMSRVDSTLATAIRSVVMTVALVAVAVGTGAHLKIDGLDRRAIGMIVLAGIAGAASWWFYFRAIQVGEVTRVAPIDKLSMPLAVVLAALALGERPSPLNWVGVGLIAAGAYLAAMAR